MTFWALRHRGIHPHISSLWCWALTRISCVLVKHWTNWATSPDQGETFDRQVYICHMQPKKHQLVMPEAPLIPLWLETACHCLDTKLCSLLIWEYATKITLSGFLGVSIVRYNNWELRKPIVKFERITQFCIHSYIFFPLLCWAPQS